LLEANHVREAILQLGRVVELEDSRASAHNALGFAYLLNEDPNAARAEYGRALDSDPTYEKARANLAALKCRYADVEGAKRELSVIKENALTGADVDPEWKSCK
jgi:cellulose synthase operon protein C